MHCQSSFAKLVALCGDAAKHFGGLCRRPVGRVVKRAEIVVVLLPSVSTDRIRSLCRRRYYFPPLFCYALSSLTFCFNRSLSTTSSLWSGTSCNQHSTQLQAPGEAGLVRRHSVAVVASKYGTASLLALGSIFSSRRIYDVLFTQPRSSVRSRRYSTEQFSSSATTTTSSRDNMLSSPACERNREPILQAMTPFLRERLKPGGGSNARAGAVTEEGSLCPQHGSTGFPALLLEVAAGTGQHMSHIAPYFPSLKYLPTDISQSHLRSIEAYRLHGAHSNTLPAVVFDVSADWTDKHSNAQLSQALREYYSCSDSLEQSEGLQSSPSVTEWCCCSRTLSKIDFMYCANMIHISSNAAVDGLFRNAGLMLKPAGLLFTYGPYAFHSVIQPDSNVRFHRSLQRDNAEWGLRDIDQLEKLAACHGLELLSVQPLPANNHFVVFERTPSGPSGTALS